MDRIPMNTSGTKRIHKKGRIARVVLAVLGIFLIPSSLARAEDGKHRFIANGTLGAELYVIDPPYDTSNVTGFFEQYRYIRNQGATLPYFVDLFHLNAGVVRSDDTYLIRLERWSRNALNENGSLEVDWRGLDVDLEYRRYRSDSLRFFPKGTEYDWTGPPAQNSYGTQYHPDTPYDDVFSNNRRIFLKRQSVLGEVALRPERFGHALPVMEQLRVRGGYETRKGYRQDSFLLAVPQENPSENRTESFRGNRRKVNQSVSSAGTTFVISPFGLLNGTLSFDFEQFEEKAPTVQLMDLQVPLNGFSPPPSPGEDRGFFFIPDTRRFMGRFQLSRRTEVGGWNVGVFASRLEQFGRRSPLQEFYQLCQGRGTDCGNAITTVSAHVDSDIALPGSLELRAWLKYMYRDSDQARQNFLSDAFQVLGDGFQESPYIQERNEVKGGLELALQPMRGLNVAVGSRFDWVNRTLNFPPVDPFPLGVQPAVSLIKPQSLEYDFYMKVRLRLLRSLQLSGELSQMWAPEVAYPNDLSQAIRFRLRSSYSFGSNLPLPLTLTASGFVRDGKNTEFPLPNSLPGESRSSEFEQTVWGYDFTLTALPLSNWVTFLTFSENEDQQSFGYVRSDYPRYINGIVPVSFYIDSIPHYTSNVKSLSIGARFAQTYAWEAEVSASLTWVSVGAVGESDVGSNVGQLINQANEIENRILTLNSEFSYPVSHRARLGAGYRFQQFVDSVQLDPIDLNETVHTVTFQFSFDLEGSD